MQLHYNKLKHSTLCTVCHSLAAKRDNMGQSPLEAVIEYLDDLDDDPEEPGNLDGQFEVALYLVNCGCGGDQEKIRILCGACYWGNLDVVKKLVEGLKLDPSECFHII